jgi:hypothetical protein
LIPQNDAVDVAFDGSGTVRQGESVEHGGEVAAQSSDESVQVRQVVGVDGGHPGVEAFALAAGEDLGERLDMAAVVPRCTHAARA